VLDETIIHAAPANDNPDPSAWPIWFYGVVGVLVVVLSVLALQVLFGVSTKFENEKKSNSLATIERLKVREDQTIQLDSYRWIDEPNGIAAIPIDRAMDLVIEDLAEAREK
jgi:hypothetical protein